MLRIDKILFILGSGGKKNRQKERRLMKGFNIAPAPTGAAAAAVAAGLPNCAHLPGVADLLVCAGPAAGSGGHPFQGSEEIIIFFLHTVLIFVIHKLIITFNHVR